MRGYLFGIGGVSGARGRKGGEFTENRVLICILRDLGVSAVKAWGEPDLSKNTTNVSQKVRHCGTCETFGTSMEGEMLVADGWVD